MARTHPMIGELQHRISVDNPSNTPDGSGGYTVTWGAASPGEVWAAIQPATASVIERMVGDTVEAKVSHIVTMRYHSGVSTQTRVTFKNRIFWVRGVQNVNEDREWLILACEEHA